MATARSKQPLERHSYGFSERSNPRLRMDLYLMPSAGHQGQDELKDHYNSPRQWQREIPGLHFYGFRVCEFRHFGLFKHKIARCRPCPVGYRCFPASVTLGAARSAREGEQNKAKPLLSDSELHRRRASQPLAAQSKQWCYSRVHSELLEVDPFGIKNFVRELRNIILEGFSIKR